VLNAVVGPEARLVRLGGVGGVCDGREVDVGFLGGVVRGEGDVVCGMPVFGGNFDGEGEREERVYGWDYIAAIGDGEGAVLEWKWLVEQDEAEEEAYGWAEVLLKVNYY
jgi:hypothetical protein